MTQEVLSAIREAFERDEAVALATIVRAQGSTPQRVGAKMVVYEDGRIVGTIGGGCYENDALGKAREALETGRSRLVKYDLNDDFAEESGLICGGQMDVFIEPLLPDPHLFIVGAGHVAFHLSPLAARVGFRVHVVDDREKFANTDRFPDAVEIVVDSIPDWLDRGQMSRRAYAVIVTRGHRNDLDALRALARRDLHYIGLIGSRAKVARLYDQLENEPDIGDRLKRIHAPIGLDLGAVTPEEIAVSIVAELIAVKYGKARYNAGERPEDASSSLRWTPPAGVR